MKLLTVAIALGSHLGDSRAAVETALECLDRWAGICLEARSHWYRTAPKSSWKLFSKSSDNSGGCAGNSGGREPSTLICCSSMI